MHHHAQFLLDSDPRPLCVLGEHSSALRSLSMYKQETSPFSATAVHPLTLSSVI